MNELFTWPYIIKNNAGIELLWLKVCRAVSVVPPVVPAPPAGGPGAARRGYIPE